MRRSKRLACVSASVLVGYFLLGNLARIRPNSEIFPFFTWGLFSQVPQPISEDFGLRVLAIDCRPIEPRYLERAHDQFPRAVVIGAYHTVQQIGQALRRNDPKMAEHWAQVLESAYLGGGAGVRYAIVHQRFNVLERHRTGQFLSEQDVGTFDRCPRE